MRAYGQSLADLGLTTSSHFFVILRDFLIELGKKITPEASSETILLVIKLWALIPDSSQTKAEVQQLTDKFSKTVSATKTARPEVKLIDQWNSSILERTLNTSFDCNNPTIGQTAALGGGASASADFYKLAKFNLIMDQKEPMNWLLLIKSLTDHGKMDIAEHL